MDALVFSAYPRRSDPKFEECDLSRRPTVHVIGEANGTTAVSLWHPNDAQLLNQRLLLDFHSSQLQVIAQKGRSGMRFLAGFVWKDCNAYLQH